MKAPGIHEILNKIKKNPENYKHAKIFDIFITTLYLFIALIIMINIAQFSYKAWLYPIRMQQYYDECSYLAMGKYFRAFSPVTLFKEYLLQDKEIPKVYNEFYNRLVYWPLILAYPMGISDDRVFLHKFRALFMAAGTIVFFLIGLRLGGITGGFIASVSWFTIPVINYWGHFFMTENPSFIFLIAGFLCFLLSGRFRLASLLGGIFIGLACFTRFTTMALAVGSPLFIIAVYFDPLKRKSYQILGELSKAFAGLIFAMLPFLAFTWFLHGNPLVPFTSARGNVDHFPVNDPFYYVRSLWLEAGPTLKSASMLAIAAPVILALAALCTIIYQDRLRLMKNITIIKKNKFNKLDLQRVLKRKIMILRYMRIFIMSLISNSLILVTLIICASIYIKGVTDVPHKLPRYMMGGLIPVIIAGAMGIGVFEVFLVRILRLGANILITHKIGYNFKKIPHIIVIIVFITLCSATLIGFFTINTNIWDKSVSRPYYNEYHVPERVIKELEAVKDFTSIRRLQPEYNAWKISLMERLKSAEENEENGIDNTDYFNPYYWKTINYLNQSQKRGEVVYIDRLNRIPFTPSYINGPCIFIDKEYGYSLNYLKRNNYLEYNGYVIIFNRPQDEILNYGKKTYIRTLNKEAVDSNKNFIFLKKIGYRSIYYYNGGKDFPYHFGLHKDKPFELTNKILTENKVSEEAKDISKENEKENTKDESRIKKVLKELFFTWIHLFAQDDTAVTDDQRAR